MDFNAVFRIPVTLLVTVCLTFSCQRDQGESAKAAKADSAQYVFRPLVNSRLPLSRLIDSLKIPVSSLNIRITKSDYELGVYNDSICIKSYRVVFGSNPEDDKLRRGDGCTPEGMFKVRSKYPHKAWSKFIWIDYPNEDSWQKHNLAKKKGLIPAKANIGGNIGIHGVPKGGEYAIDYRQNWTLGCISMKNSDVDELYEVIHPQIAIEIRK